MEKGLHLLSRGTTSVLYRPTQSVVGRTHNVQNNVVNNIRKIRNHVHSHTLHCRHCMAPFHRRSYSIRLLNPLQVHALSSSVGLQRRYFATSTSDDDDFGTKKEEFDEDDEEKNQTKTKLEELLKSEEEEARAMLPREIVIELDKFIIGQQEAKRAVAIALRNRWRRHQLPAAMRDEVIPKNILMIGPTGVGKTEIARRLAKLISAPFIKVEATKFTEVGFHGRDVDQIIRDLVDISINNTRQRLAKRYQKRVDEMVDKAVLDALLGQGGETMTSRDSYLRSLRAGQLDSVHVEIEVPEYSTGTILRHGRAGSVEADPEIGGGIYNLFKLFEKAGPTRRRKMPVAEARRILERKEREHLFDHETVVKLAIHSVEQDGIVFIDEIDKICEKKDSVHTGADASSEGVQRDLLPIIEGCIIHTKHGNVDTSHILFVASGAFHQCKPSDLISELQGRLPIRVELKALTQEDLCRILTETENNQIKQQMELMKTEGVDLQFTDRAVQSIARVAAEVNSQVENIGARRLHTVIERIMEDISFNCDLYKDKKVVLDEEDIKKHLGDMLLKTDLSRFIL
jgi:ATP-dependent HslUV protease ATP-binding subunit HslU